VAIEFVLAAPRLDTAKLRRAIGATRESPATAEDRARLAAALASPDPQKGLELLAAIETEGKTLFGARVLAARARFADTAKAHRAAADAGRYLGWLRLAAESEGRAALRFEGAGKHGDAVAAARARLELETLRGRTANLADALLEAGRLSLLVAELPEAEDLLRRALRQSQRNKSAALQAESKRLLGLTLAARGSSQDARIYLLQAVEEYRELKDGSRMLASLEPVIELDHKLDGIAPAMERGGQALALARSLEDRRAEGRVLAVMGHMEQLRKDWTAAVARFDAAESALRSAEAIDAAGAAAYNSGVLSLRMGRRDAARVSLSRAEADAKAAEDDSLQAKVQSTLGDLCLELGQVDAAARHLKSAAKLAEATRNPALAARALSRLGRLALRRDKPEEARDRLEQALAQLRTTRDTEDEVRTLLALGEAERRLGKRERAEQLADEVAAIARRDQLPGVLARAAALRAQAALGPNASAQQAAVAFEPLRAAAREAIAMHESSKLASTPRFEADLDRMLRVGVDLALTADDATLVLRVCEFRRSRAMLAALGGRRALLRVLTSDKLQRLREKTEQDEEDAVAEYERQRERMDKNAMLKARDKVMGARTRLAEVDQRIDAELRSAKALLAPGVTPLETIQDALAPTESLLYFCTGAETVGVVVATRGGTRMIALGARRELEAAVTALRNALTRDNPDDAIERVRQLLLLPLAIGDTLRDLVIVPVSPVDRVPFCLLDDQCTVRYCDSAASLVQTTSMAKQRGTGVLGIGNSSFASPDIRIRLVHLSNGIPVQRLETGQKLAEMFDDVVIVGPSATTAQVRTAVGSRDRWQAIHFAAPGLLDARKPSSRRTHTAGRVRARQGDRRSGRDRACRDPRDPALGFGARHGKPMVDGQPRRRRHDDQLLSLLAKPQDVGAARPATRPGQGHRNARLGPSEVLGRVAAVGSALAYAVVDPPCCSSRTRKFLVARNESLAKI